MTDRKYLWTIKSDRPGQPDDRIVRKVYRITRDQVMESLRGVYAEVIHSTRAPRAA